MWCLVLVCLLKSIKNLEGVLCLIMIIPAIHSDHISEISENSSWIQHEFSPLFFMGTSSSLFACIWKMTTDFQAMDFHLFIFWGILKNYVVLKSFIISEYLFLVFITNLSNCPLNFGYLFHIFRLSIIII